MSFTSFETVSGGLFCNFDRAMFTCFFICHVIFAEIWTFEKRATPPILMNWLHVKKDLHQSAWLEILGASQIFSGDVSSLGLCM